MDVTGPLVDSFGRIGDRVADLLSTLDRDTLRRRLADSSNSIGWLLWHTTRVQDAHVAELLGAAQVWTEGSHASAQHRTADPADTGYGHSDAEAAAVEIFDIGALATYHEAVAARTLRYLRTLDPSDLDREVDESWDPPVTVAVRLVSIIEDSFLHLGQAAFVRGVLEGQRTIPQD